ncbi:hypothetical protein EXU57_01650 [Segetibacter sp. 3557_3]|uniref:hypothetical protein n=1 Tax=Segetibacter sp. 3557_3 TaxID=2547429 RepID=UPI0010588BEE|nr:hypothetical protein [Segetibacter sp. 3557_3]TDH28801.1 hypothetical protein EXU57_01650 [Segetibacter sp. 3557_3]
MKTLRHLLLVFTIGLLVSCAGLKYSASAYNDDIAIKEIAVALIKKSNEPYAMHAAEIDALKASVIRAAENEKMRKGNSSTVAMWNQVMTGKGNLFDLLDTWKSGNQLSPEMATQASTQIELLLNNIADLESKKRKT